MSDISMLERKSARCPRGTVKAKFVRLTFGGPQVRYVCVRRSRIRTEIKRARETLRNLQRRVPILPSR